MINYKTAFILLFTTILVIEVKAQVNHDTSGNFDYIQNYVFPANHLPYDVSNRFRIGNQVSTQTTPGNVIIPSNASVTIQTLYSFSEIYIKSGFEIRPNSFFSFLANIPVGNDVKWNNPYGYVALTYNLDNTGYLNLEPLTFSNPANKSPMWGLEIYNEGLNFWRPYGGGEVNYKLFIATSGNIGMGKNPSYKLDVNGDIAANGSFITSSDKRLKSEIKPLTGCRAKFNQLNGKSYNKAIESEKNLTKTNQSKQMGLIAQDVIKIYPELVTQDSSGIYSLDYMGLLPIIIETLKEQKQRYNCNTKKINELKQYINEHYASTL